MPKLGVNIDHVATLRQARRGYEPDPLLAAKLCEKAGAHSIVAHLREDRRHINDEDIELLKKNVKTRFNLEMSINPEIVQIACQIKPDQATLVPERRQEITTEGGLDVLKYFTPIQKVTHLLKAKDIVVSLFVAPDKKQIDAAYKIGVNMIELHTGHYASAKTKQEQTKELKKIKTMTYSARRLGLIVNAGHGLNYQNTERIAEIKEIAELNIGHSIISKAVFVGLEEAVKDMLKVMAS